MYFKKLENGIPVGGLLTDKDILRIFPEVNMQSADALVEIGFVAFNLSDKPKNLNHLQEAVEITPIRNGDGSWNQTWDIVDIEFASEEERTAHIDEVSKAAVTNMINFRNYLLSLTDYHALSDTADMSADMQEYRQALRDLPETTNDVFNIEWPVNPEDTEGLLR